MGLLFRSTYLYVDEAFVMPKCMSEADLELSVVTLFLRKAVIDA